MQASFAPSILSESGAIGDSWAVAFNGAGPAKAGELVALTADNFDAEVMRSRIPVIIEYGFDSYPAFVYVKPGADGKAKLVHIDLGISVPPLQDEGRAAYARRVKKWLSDSIRQHLL